MQYDPIKRTLGKVFNTTPVLRKMFYGMLDLLLLRAWHIKHELKEWKTLNPEAPEILDAGSGFGQYVYRMSQMFSAASIKGVDVKQEQIDDCNSFFKSIGKDDHVKFEYADLTAFNDSDKYDLILSVDVMEHILEDVKVFENFYSSMKKGGILLVSTPSDQGGSDTHDHDHDETGGFIDEHVRDGYNIQEIEDKLKNAGFKNIKARYTYGKPGKISWKLSMKYPIQMLGTSKLFYLALPFYYLITFPFMLLLNSMDLHGSHPTGSGLIVKAYK